MWDGGYDCKVIGDVLYVDKMVIFWMLLVVDVIFVVLIEVIGFVFFVGCDCWFVFKDVMDCISVVVEDVIVLIDV